ncbi:Uncharacterised protein [Mycobacteroides abscessus subsp. abscessus]|nr:Uncharacterised protein [Mycobacteroides abscessus subsp. abscessus]
MRCTEAREYPSSAMVSIPESSSLAMVDSRRSAWVGLTRSP